MATICRSASDVGRRRDHNEDAYLVDEALQLYVVCDGMGGHACGEIASGIATQAFRDYVEERSDIVWGFRDGSPSVATWMVRRLLEDAVHAACREVWRKAQDNPAMRGMGTTIVGLVVAGDRTFVVNVGDSRAYLVRDGIAVQLTRDHSVLNELLRRGEITEESANTTYAQFTHALARAVGVCEDVEVDSSDVETVVGDAFVLASDGLTGYLKPGELPSLVGAVDDDLATALVALANDRGGEDNITAIVVRHVPDPTDPTADEQRARDFATKIAAFRALPLFRRLEYAELIRVLATSDVTTLPAGEVVLREGEEGDAMYVVLEGRVGLDKAGVRIAEFAHGAHFGEVSLVDRAPRSATATVLEQARLLRLRREQLDALVQRDPEIAVKLLWSFAETLGERLRSTTDGLAEARAAAAGRAESDAAARNLPMAIATPAAESWESVEGRTP
jgi:PPM family protein phosphatase